MACDPFQSRLPQTWRRIGGLWISRSCRGYTGVGLRDDFRSKLLNPIQLSGQVHMLPTLRCRGQFLPDPLDGP